MYYFLRIYKHRILWSVFVPAVTSCFFALSTMLVENAPLIYRFTALFYYANNPTAAPAMIMTLLNYFMLLCCITGVFTDDLQIHTTYCFTRKKSVVKWYFSAIGSLMTLSLICVVSFVIFGTASIALSGGYPLSDYTAIAPEILKTILLVWLFVFCIGFLVNSFSLLFKKKFVFPVFVIILSGLGAVIPYSISEKMGALIYLNPVVHLNSTLHSDIFKQAYKGFEVPSIDPKIIELSLLDSLLYFALLAAAAFIIGIIILKKTDISLKSEE